MIKMHNTFKETADNNKRQGVTAIATMAAVAGLSIGTLASLPTFAIEENVNFQVNVSETLTVAITTESNNVTGDIGDFLRNKVTVNVTTNATDGFTASMTTKTSDTSLHHNADKGTPIQTLASNSARSSFPSNRWGFSVNDTDAGSSGSTYQALVGANSSTPTTLISRVSGQTTASKDVYFGAKADSTQASGTYSGTVVISVVTGVTDQNTNPVIPENPAQPGGSEETPHYYPSPTGDGQSGSTVYSYTRTNSSTGASTTTTEVSSGDTRTAYNGYTAPQGVTDRSVTTSNISEGNSLATGLAVTAATAATSGLIFFIVAKRKKDDDEEDEEQQQ